MAIILAYSPMISAIGTLLTGSGAIILAVWAIKKYFKGRENETKLLIEIENKFDYVEKYELYTGYKDEKNLYLYKKSGYIIFKEETINENLKMVFMEKYNKK